MHVTSRDFLVGTMFIIAGTLILVNLESFARFDQQLGVRFRSWRDRKLGNSLFNWELWPVGTPKGLKASTSNLRICGLVLLIGGMILVLMSFV